MRQGVISISEYINGEYWPSQEIVFRQPYHSFGIGYTFNFTKSFFSPFSNCTIVLYNPSPEIADSLKFDPQKPYNRPKIEIRGGESDFRLTNYSQGNPSALIDINPLKDTLPLVYTGHPFYFSEDKHVGGKILTIQCSDMALSTSTTRINQQFIAGVPVLGVLQKIAPTADLTDAASLSGVVTTSSLYYNNSLLHSEVLPELARNYKFHYYFTQENVLKVISSGTAPEGDKDTVANNQTGLIEYPTSVNWSFWNVKTFFGRPTVFYPGQWMTVDTDNLKGSPILFGYKQGIREFFGKKSGLVVEAKYNWSDESADITYIISPDGNPVETSPIIAL